MIVVGLSTHTHDSSVALVVNGRTICLFEEERFNRIKHTADFPWNSLDQVFKSNSLAPSDVDAFCFSWHPLSEITGNFKHVVSHLPKSLNLIRATPNDDTQYSPFKKWLDQKNFLHSFNLRYNTKSKAVVKSIPHHLCHAAVSFFNSPFESATFLSLDGRGESMTSSWGHAHKNQLPQIRGSLAVPHSLGHFYSAITSYLGFKPFSDEWKVMGLSAYGTNRFVNEFEKMIFLISDGTYKLNLKYFSFPTHGRKKWVSDFFIQQFQDFRSSDPAVDFQVKKDIAYAAQNVLEKTAVHMTRTLFKSANSKNLCLSGGVALNCLMNSKISDESGFKDVFIPPFPHDAGNSLGAAQWYTVSQGLPLVNLEFTPFLGLKNSEEEIENTISQFNLKFKKSDQILEKVATLIADGKIVGWYQGSAEAGPRALGNRSLLADPRRLEIKDRLNLITKKRENFRPFAPSILVEKAGDFVETSQQFQSPYMILTAQVRSEKRDLIKAVTHVDGSARFQTVDKDLNPRFYTLIQAFYEKTGVPVLLNTSFNENEPIVNSPAEAIRCFLRTDLDALALGDYLIEKSH